MNGASKIRSAHRERLAIIYVRQSTLAQVYGHTESTARQYALADEATRLGWEASRIVVIDADLRVSGRTASAREWSGTGYLRRRPGKCKGGPRRVRARGRARALGLADQKGAGLPHRVHQGVDVGRGGAVVKDAGAEGESSAEHRAGQEDSPVGLDPLDQGFVERVEVRRVPGPAGRRVAEADHRQP